MYTLEFLSEGVVSSRQFPKAAKIKRPLNLDIIELVTQLKSVIQRQNYYASYYMTFVSTGWCRWLLSMLSGGVSRCHRDLSND